MIRIAPSNPRHRDSSQFKPLSQYVVLLEECVVELVAADILVRRVERTAGDDDGAY